MNTPECPYYIGGPYADGTWSVCDVATGRILRVFRNEIDLREAAGVRRVQAPAFGIDHYITAEAGRTS